VPKPAHTPRRRVLERLWIVGSVAYGGLRIFVADRTVRRYGVNIWAFAVVELGTSFVYGLGTARVVGALVDRRRDQVMRWAPLAAGAFLAPEAFIVVSGRRMPTVVYAVVGLVVLVMGTVAVVSLTRKVRAGRQLVQSPARAACAPTTTPPGTRRRRS
jgi:hypothetical protein